MQGAVLRFLGISAMKYNTTSLFSVHLKKQGSKRFLQREHALQNNKFGVAICT